jgi:hypothetical protein
MRGGPVAAVLFLAVGAALIVRTVQLGVGGGLGLVLGALLVAAGCLRLYLLRR